MAPLWVLAIPVAAAGAGPDFGALLARSAHLARGGQHIHRKKVNLRFLTDVIAKGMRRSSEDDALDAIDAIEELSLMGKPPGLMDAINKMRCEVCWKRPDVLSHKKCVKFFAKVCKGGGGSCKDVCTDFLKLLQKECYNPNTEKPPAQQWCDLYEEITGVKCPKPEAGDSDGDGHPDAEDVFPEDPKEWADEDGDGIGDNSDPDRDGDGYPNEKDAFPDDKTEWLDTDGDGIGDNADADRDGDGCENDVDDYPLDKTRCHYVSPPAAAKAPAGAPAAPAGPPGDRDGDGHADGVDAFPDDPNEWLDSDGDGYGDNKDPWPHNPNCYHPGEPCGKEDGAHEITDAQKQQIDPATLNKIEQGLPSQGYDEHSGGLVEHDDGDTFSADWQTEWPQWNRESERQSIDRICEEEPNNEWCRSKERRRQFTR